MANNSRVIVIVVAIAVFGILAGLFFANFEIYQGEKQIEPSRLVRQNVYLAADRWLNRSGHPVRVEKWGNGGTLASASEKTALIFTSSFDKRDYGQLTTWLDSGNSAALFIDSPLTDELTDYLASFGIICSVDDEDYDIIFEFNGNESSLITVPSGFGNGELSVTGIPYFMQSRILAKTYSDYTDDNFRLTWFLSGERDPKQKGILVIRSKAASAGETRNWREEGTPDFFAKLREAGSILPVAISALLTLLIGFWMTLPVFGKLQKDVERPGKPIRERFRAEGLFFKKYNALGTYLAIYADEIKRRLRKNGLPESAVDTEILNPPVHISPKQFVDSLNTTEKTLETL
jgi:hypothetical protein